MKKYAFTLAEVLITHGIIGVVAALTLPPLISKYQKYVWYNKFLKSVSTIENYVKIACYSIGYEDVENCDLFSEHILPASSEKFSDIALKNVVGAKVIPYDEIYGNPKYIGTKELNGNYVFEDHTYYVDSDVLMFSDGTAVYFSDYSGGSDLAIDINGPFKGPNTFGRDIFFFWGILDSPYKFGIFWVGADNSNKTEDSCNINGDGYTCAGRLLKEGRMNY